MATPMTTNPTTRNRARDLRWACKPSSSDERTCKMVFISVPHIKLDWQAGIITVFRRSLDIGVRD